MDTTESHKRSLIADREPYSRQPSPHPAEDPFSFASLVTGWDGFQDQARYPTGTRHKIGENRFSIFNLCDSLKRSTLHSGNGRQHTLQWNHPGNKCTGTPGPYWSPRTETQRETIFVNPAEFVEGVCGAERLEEPGKSRPTRSQQSFAVLLGLEGSGGRGSQKMGLR
ncbi:hypothetical protein I7I51_00249 [Histoplasma capsulatum]|uniref:Uncharacterized protein n=1 Tax=Ajellomyces capsulatus TaxID=5037 RepID=A0A8A1MF79_AJECA|nr:hypothetical protein I7I51_00249 [Histoplasma capsulatum]